MNGNDYKVVYDEELFGPGYLIYKETNGHCSMFLKIYKDNMYGFPEYCVVAQDWSRDDRDIAFREIVIPVTNSDTIYYAVKNLHKSLNGDKITTVNAYDFGNSNIMLKQVKDNYVLTVNKDVWNGKKVKLNYASVLIGDNISGKHWGAVNEFYTNVARVANLQKPEEVTCKVLKLIKY